MTEAVRGIQAALLLASFVCGSGAFSQAVTVRNNHDIRYQGAVELPASVPPGRYVSASGTTSQAALANVARGSARAIVDIPPRSEVVLQRIGTVEDAPAPDEPVAARHTAGGVRLLWRDATVGDVAYDLAVIRDTTAGVDDAVRGFAPLDLRWLPQPDGSWAATSQRNGHSVTVTMFPAAGGSVDFRARVSRSDEEPGSRAYLALVRRVTTSDNGAAKLRFNGRQFEGPVSPEIWDRDFWYTHGVDWISWKAGPRTILAVNGFSPVPPIARAGGWREASHFWVWEKTRRVNDSQFLVSEIAGPNKNQTAVSPYSPLAAGDTVTLTWRLAVHAEPSADWEEGQLHGFAGPRFVSTDSTGIRIDLGVRDVTFGVSYFPYSTLTENFDYYRTPGLNKEGFWAFSPALWMRWRELAPRMRTDMHIIRAMGFERVRLHHLELLQKMDRGVALAFLDFLIGEARSLDMRVLIDSEGPAEWLALLAGRYAESLVGFELENEILIGGIAKGGPERWKNLYSAVKAVAPATEVFVTGVGNNGMYERLRTLGVPFDRVGLHAYKHGPQWKEAFASHMLGTASYASSLGMPVTLGEFNWKDLTRLSPPARLIEYTQVYEQVLGARAIPEVFHFQFQESLSFNPAIAGTFSRHYETLRVDRRPKPEAFELMRLIRKYAAPEAPVNELSVSVSRSRLAGGSATAGFSISNTAARPLRVSLAPLAFDGLASVLASAKTIVLNPGETRRGTVRLGIAPRARPGTYHHFIKASYGSKSVIGWGVTSLEGAPSFDPFSVLPHRASYPQGVSSVSKLNWRRPLAVVFGGEATVLELETAYAITNTLQSATGKDVWLSAEADLPDSLAAWATVVVVGTPAANELVRARGFDLTPGRGSIITAKVRGNDWLFLTGLEKTDAQAAAVDFMLRYWKNAKDSIIRLTGMERGAALGNRIAGVVVDPP